MDVDEFVSVVIRVPRIARTPLVNCCVVLGKYNKVYTQWKLQQLMSRLPSVDISGIDKK